jgi:hypothetical protein
MFGQVQRKIFTNRVICHSPKWVSCGGIHLANGRCFLPLSATSSARLRCDGHGDNHLARRFSDWLRNYVVDCGLGDSAAAIHNNHCAGAKSLAHQIKVGFG